MIKPFVIIAGGRCGSTLLAESLDNQPNISCAGEVFHPDRDLRRAYGRLHCDNWVEEDQSWADWGWEWIWNNWGSAPSRGCKLLYTQARTAKANQNGLWTFLKQHTEIKIIHLRRRNLLRCLVSWRVVQSSRIWNMVQANHWVPWELTPVLSAFKAYLPPVVDLNLNTLIKELDTLSQLQQQWRFGFEGHDILELAYEELTQGPLDYQDTMKKTCEFLGEEYRPAEPPLVQLLPGPWQQYVSNHEEVKKTLRWTPYAEFC